jgi:hypothetical protein
MANEPLGELGDPGIRTVFGFVSGAIHRANTIIVHVTFFDGPLKSMRRKSEGSSRNHEPRPLLKSIAKEQQGAPL